jgi:uncharacterized protein (DUF433 family)
MAGPQSSDMPGIESHPGVCGGDPCIGGTRIPVWLLVRYRQLRMSDADLLKCYPTLQAEDLANAWEYERSHQQAVEQQIVENEKA